MGRAQKTRKGILQSGERSADLSAPASRFSVHEDGGVFRFRETGRIDEKWNPDGLSLDCIRLELAPGLGFDKPPDKRIAFRTGRIVAQTPLSGSKGLSDTVVFDADLHKAGTEPRSVPDLLSHLTPLTSPSHDIVPDLDLVQPGDEELATTIRDWPAVLLRSRVHQRALARWSLAIWHGANRQHKVAAKNYLATASEAYTGNPTTSPVGALQFLKAVEDAQTYGRLLQQCMQECIDTGNSIEAVRSTFHDLETIEDLGFAIKDIIEHPLKYSPPAPDTLAIAFLSSELSLSRAQIKKIAAKARKLPSSET